MALCVCCQTRGKSDASADVSLRATPTVDPLAGVVNPWLWERARGASDAERAIEDIGPYEALAEGAAPVNTNAHYWTASVGLPWDRDVDLDIEREPVDLDGDGTPDTRVTRHVHARGGILANPELFGLTRTPDDPRGRPGRISASTGVLGLREALDRDGHPTGEIGMTCWLCHGAALSTMGAVSLGLAGARFDYGLLLATADVLDERNVAAAAARAAREFPPGRLVRARLLLAGPGRQDLTGEFGLDVTVPFHSARYVGTRRVRQGTKGIVNPISVPAILAAPGLDLENWSGSEDAEAPWLERLLTLSGRPVAEEGDVLAALGLAAPDRAASRRALLLDLRNLGTLGLQQDSFPGLLWADALAGRAELPPEALRAVPPMYATVAVRRALAATAAALARASAARPLTPAEAARVARGRALFGDRVVGVIANRQVLKRAPAALAAAQLEGPILAPIDPTRPLDARLPVRCADCHSAAPLERVRPLAESPPPLGRCSHCHLAHPPLAAGDADTPASPPRPPPLRRRAGEDDRLVPLAALGAPPSASGEVGFCARCHARHRDFGPMVYSGSRLFPFDADGDGDAQGHPDADARAGGIGTEPLLAFDVPRPQRPFALDLPVAGADPTAPTRVTHARVGVAWVRAAPLLAVSATAPYLHNGSVPTLRALLEPARARPATFPLGAAGFVFDTRLSGNRNTGHEFGTTLTAAEKDDLVAFLETL
jgi:hypothetical protein